MQKYQCLQLLLHWLEKWLTMDISCKQSASVIASSLGSIPLKHDNFNSIENENENDKMGYSVICDKYDIEPSFNYAKGTIEQITRISYTNIYIKQIISHIIYVLPEVVTNNFELELKANQYNYILIIHGLIDELNANKYINAPFNIELIYFKTKYNSKRYKVHLYQKFKSIHNLTYSPEMFVYNDDNTINKVIQVLQENRFDTRNYCFIGGDSILYSKVLEYNYAVFYTDTYLIHNYFMENISNHKIDKSKINKKYVNLNTFDLSFHLNYSHMLHDNFSIVYEINDSHHYYNILIHLCKVLPKYLYLIIPAKLRDNIPFFLLSNAGYTIRNIICINNFYSPIYIMIMS